MATREQQAAALRDDWAGNPRWAGIRRSHTAEDVVRLRGSVQVEHTLAHRGAASLWQLVQREPFVTALGALTGHQAVQQVMAGLQAIHVGGALGPDPFDPASAAPAVVTRINDTLRRADQIQWAEGRDDFDFLAPVVAQAQADGVPAAFELVKALVEAGAAGVHVDDSLAAARHCDVLVPTRQAVERLCAARLAADVMGTATVLIARTHAHVADLLACDVDEADRPFCTGERTVQGYHRVRPGIEQAIARAVACAPYADIVSCASPRPNLAGAQRFAEAVQARFPGKLLAYDCSASVNWKKHLDDGTIARFQKELGAMGYRFQFIAEAGFHALNHGMFDLAHGCARRHLPAFVALQEAEFAAAGRGFTSPRHQRELGTGYFDAVTQAVSGVAAAAEQCGGVQRVA
ncbi:isocitrate lyase [[Empedobacter] haloabium]|uniref:Isocitrate lyase n=1 Tax=[Empedobacter] haloabium TaxID=592317 RepID=A0ABZ1UH91_9BURK